MFRLTKFDELFALRRQSVAPAIVEIVLICLYIAKRLSRLLPRSSVCCVEIYLSYRLRCLDSFRGKDDSVEHTVDCHMCDTRTCRLESFQNSTRMKPDEPSAGDALGCSLLSHRISHSWRQSKANTNSFYGRASKIFRSSDVVLVPCCQRSRMIDGPMFVTAAA